MVICGIDASTNKTGIAIFMDGEYIVHTLIDLHRESNADVRILKMMCEICAFLDRFGIDKIIMEKSILKTNVDTVQKLSNIAGAVMLYAAQHDIEFENPVPSVWRKRIGLQQSNKIKRAALKLEAVQAVKQEYDMNVTDDEAESILIARSGYKLPTIEVKADEVLWGNE